MRSLRRFVDAVQLLARHAIDATQDRRLRPDRADELEQLVSFGSALGRSLELDAISTAAAEHLPLFAEGRKVWVLLRNDDSWVHLAGTRVSDGSAERAASAAIGVTPPSRLTEPYCCVPMVVAGVPVGVIGVSPVPPLAVESERGLWAAAALLGASIKNAELFAAVRDSSLRDPLTTCFTKKHAQDVLDAEIRRASRSRLPLSVVMFDLDHFKSINDRFGHLAGDAVLAAVGRQLSSALRASDVKCRYGGDEFLIVLPETALAGALRVAETIRRDLAAQPVQWREVTIPVTASFGVAERLCVDGADSDVESLVATADVALYRAKQQGRNSVELAEPPAAYV